jgi:ABC-type branched-subunit amino acid transport system substrate-binding protein
MQKKQKDGVQFEEKAGKCSLTRREFMKVTGGAIGATAVTSLAGPWVISARGEQCMELAVEEINEKGGVLGRKIETVAEDDNTSPDLAVQKSSKMVQKDKVLALFGVVFSSVRAAVVANVATRFKVPYFYPTMWEGKTSCSRYFISMGPVPNQQLDFFIPFLINKLGPRMYCIGYDYIWPRESIAHIENLLEKHGGKLVGKEFVPFDQSEWASIIAKVKVAKPDVLIPFCAGNGTVVLLKQFYDFGWEGIKVACTYMDELYVPAFEAKLRAGIQCSSPYYMDLDTATNRAFIARFRKKFGPDAVVCSLSEGQYDSVYIWKLAVEKAKSLDLEKTINALDGITFEAPQGEISIDGKTNHAALHQIIAECQEDGHFRILKDFGKVLAVTDCRV